MIMVIIHCEFDDDDDDVDSQWSQAKLLGMRRMDFSSSVRFGFEEIRRIGLVSVSVQF